MGKVINAIATAVVKVTAEVVTVVDPNAGKAVASQAQSIGNSAELFTAKTGNALAKAANATGDWLEKGVSKDGAITNFVQDYVPAGGFITAIAHAAAGNNAYAQYAAVKGVSTTVVTVAAVAGSLGGPAGAILAGGLAGAAVSAWEGGMKTVLDPTVKGKLTDLSVENVLISGAIGAAGAAVGVGVGKLAGAAGKSLSSKFGKATATEVGTVVQFTRGRAGAVVGTKLNPVIPLWQIMTPGQKISAVGGVAGGSILKGAGAGGLQEAIKATGLTAAVLAGLGLGKPKPPLTQPAPPVNIIESQAKDPDTTKKKWAVLVATGVIVVGGGLVFNSIGGSENSTKPGATTPATLAATSVATTTATTSPPTIGVATTARAVVAPPTAAATTTTIKKKPTATTTPTATTPATTAAPVFAPGPVSGVTASLSGSPPCTVTVSWSPATGTSPINYIVNGSAGGSHSTESTSITFYAPADGAQTFSVYATNSVGVGPTSSSDSVSPDSCFVSPP